MTRQRATTPRPQRLALRITALLLLTLVTTMPLRAATARDLYTAALTHERELRTPADQPATLERLRDAIAAYEKIVRQFPRSGYSDNALWQAAGLAFHAFDRYRQPADRNTGVRLLRMLESEYPSSSLVPRVTDRLEQIRLLDEPVRIRAIRRETLADVVRVTIELDDEVRYDAERLDGPARLFFDFSGTYAPPPLRDATLSFDDSDIVHEIRLGRHPEQTTRVVLDIQDVDSYSLYTLYDPYRLVVDAVPTTSRRAHRETPDMPTPPTVAGDAGPPSADGVDDPFPAETPGAVQTATSPAATVDSPTAPASDDDPLRPDELPTESEPVASVEPLATKMAPPSAGALGLLPVPEGWEARRLDPIPPTHEPVASLEPAETPTPDPTPATETAPEATLGEGAELAWPHVHDVLYPDLGSTPALKTADQTPATDATEPADELVSLTPLRTPEAVAAAALVFPESMVDVLPAPQIEQMVQIVPQGPVPIEPVVADLAAESSPDTPETPPGPETPVANSGGDLSLGRQLGLGVSRIVIDPGHGGYDPGAQTGELTESALVLDVARRLEARLNADTGIEVVLTRRRDAYLPLRARTELANRVGADLFLSIHANAGKDRRARGIETYYLDLATDPNSQTVAARENAASGEGMHDLPQLVRSITMHNKLDESRDLAEMVQRNLIRGVRKLHPEAQDLGVKRAPFVVLIGANMPSVLAEISFLTNQADAAFLATDAYRDRIADALLQSILEYQQTLKPSASFAAENDD